MSQPESKGPSWDRPFETAAGQSGYEDAATLLGRLGYEARTVHDGPSALLEAPRYRPQLALIDIGLPVMDGFALAQRLRELPELQSTPLCRPHRLRPTARPRSLRPRRLRRPPRQTRGRRQAARRAR